MKATIALWNLDQSQQSIESLEQSLQTEGVEAWEKVQGLNYKYWISNKEQNIWGAFMVWDSAEAMQQTLPPNRAMELIGYPPTSHITFDIHAMVKGWEPL